MGFRPLDSGGGGGGGGGVSFSAITAGTNAAALVVGTGGSVTVSGSGTINATSLGGTAAASYALLDNPTFTTGITSPIVTITQGTITANAPQINGTATFNAAGVTFTGWKLNVTDTASASGSKLLDLQVGGASKFYVWSSGGAPGLVYSSFGFYTGTDPTLASYGAKLRADGSLYLIGPIGLGSGSVPLTYLYNGGNNIHEWRNVTAANRGNIYNTWLSSTNNEGLAQDWISTANLARIYTFKGSGGGTARAMALGTDSVDRLTFGAAGGLTIADAVGSSALTITGATQTASFPVLNLTQTWNNAGVTFTALDLNVTSTASAAASLLMNLRVGGTSQFSVSKAGRITTPDAFVANNGATPAGFYGQYAGAAYVALNSTGLLQWTSSADATGTADLLVVRDAANILAQRNGTTAQAARWENTFTSSTNREYATADWKTTANLFRLMTVKGSGGGTARAMALGTDSVDRLTFGAAGNATFATPVVLSTAVPLSMSSGTDQRAGDTTLIGGTKTVNNTTVTANTRVFAQRKTAGGTIGMSLTYTVIAATSFTLTSDNVLDTSVYSYWLLEIP